jgi:tetratricopeptide (TPR) repeat protein
MRQKKFDRAIELCKERLEKNEKEVFTLNVLGAIYMAKKDYQSAEETLERAIVMKPLWPAPYNNLARLYLVQGRTGEAIERFETALNTNPENAGAYLALGSIYEQNKDYQNAIRIYEKALEVYPGMWAAANNLAFLLGEKSKDTKDLERALTLSRRANELRPNEPLVLDTMAWIHAKLGDMIQAREILSNALAQAPDNPIFNYHMAVILFESGNAVEAKQKLEIALANNQDFLGRDEATELLKKLQ